MNPVRNSHTHSQSRLSAALKVDRERGGRESGDSYRVIYLQNTRISFPDRLEDTWTEGEEMVFYKVYLIITIGYR